MNEGRQIRVTVRTVHAVYTGGLFVPAKRKRFSDVINDASALFINLTDVRMNGSSEKIEHLSLNKYLIESIRNV
ncbi:MAG: hypothetical protein MPW17_22715 (plasmid) [Candidatus Manganitrophus sp.]|nr:hypothetical protein [Candidatus Manganitrophus sp.]WDT73447.1 MAG: hypothetical protein MPW17_22715 [Candidatus Manganitrophus sp.]WDT77923.1 MAG: hypothetical protein MPW16_21245 [Candidatus Manganitrophus sp.]